MAITMRHGPYNKFDPQKLRTGEIAVVTEGDPHAIRRKGNLRSAFPRVM